MAKKTKEPLLQSPWTLTTCERIAALRVEQRKREAKHGDLCDVRKDKKQNLSAAEAELAASIDSASEEHGSEESWPIDEQQAIHKARLNEKTSSAEYAVAQAKVTAAKEAWNTTNDELSELLDNVIAGDDLFEFAAQAELAPQPESSKPAGKSKLETAAGGGKTGLKLSGTTKDDDNVEGEPVSPQEFAAGCRERRERWADLSIGLAFRDIKNEEAAEDVQGCAEDFAKREIETLGGIIASIREADREYMSPCITGGKTIDFVFGEDPHFMRILVGWIAAMYRESPDPVIAEDLHTIAHKFGRGAMVKAFYEYSDIEFAMDDGKRAAARNKKLATTRKAPITKKKTTRKKSTRKKKTTRKKAAS